MNNHHNFKNVNQFKHLKCLCPQKRERHFLYDDTHDIVFCKSCGVILIEHGIEIQNGAYLKDEEDIKGMKG